MNFEFEVLFLMFVFNVSHYNLKHMLESNIRTKEKVHSLVGLMKHK